MSALKKLQREIVTRLEPSFELAPVELDELARACSLSDFLFQTLSNDHFKELVASGDLFRGYDGDEVAQLLMSRIYAEEGTSAQPINIKLVDEALRWLRTREMARIVFRDLTRRADLVETTRDLSNLADVCIQTALEFHYEKNVLRHGRPIGHSGKPQQMCVLALGKLGANELNVSSDVDLVFFYDESGTVDGDSGLSNQEFFIRTSRQIIKSLDTVLATGFVFRVDMRLRPYGESGALILNRASMEKYFIEQGRDWERYAFVKARAAAGDLGLGRDFLAWLRPFVYRKHLDYGAIEALREMKQLINSEVERKKLHNDIKLGAGGIREVEFIVQAQQLVWGGKKPFLQERRLLEALTKLEQDGYLPYSDTHVLRQAYIFLRNSEHVIQAEKDRQSQRLPVGELSQQRLAAAMGFESYPDYLTTLADYRDQVTACFSKVMGSNTSELDPEGGTQQRWVSLWQDPTSSESLSQLADHGFGTSHDQCQDVAQLLVDFRDSLNDVQQVAVDRIQRLIPVLLRLSAGESEPAETLRRLVPIVSNIVRRSTYLAFLLENTDATNRLVHVCGSSAWVAEQISQHPILLYELTDRNTRQRIDPDSLRDVLEEMLAQIDRDDLEAQMDSLRQFKHAMVLRVAVSELLNISTTMIASDGLTAIAEVIVSKVSELAFDHLVDRHGEPCDRSGESQGRCFAVVAYGKLGGFELAYGSDLDVVFLHDADIHGETNGAKKIVNTMFFSRLGQRIVHILSSYTRFGILYEVDLRLRPDGNKGALIGTFNGYERYLEQEAWTWEHQALVRARYVAGDMSYEERFNGIRSHILCKERDEAELMHDVKEMRTKIRSHVESEDLKHGTGAIVDIEFLVQFLVLANSHRYPALARWTDKIRLIESLETIGLLQAVEASTLQEAYVAFRSTVHYTWLGGAVVPDEKLTSYRQQVVEIWKRILG